MLLMFNKSSIVHYSLTKFIEAYNGMWTFSLNAMQNFPTFSNT